MLLKEQEETLAKIPSEAIAHVRPFNAKAREVALHLVEDLKTAIPKCSIFHLGSTKTGLAGENEIDIIVVGGESYGTATMTLSGLFGKPTSKDTDGRVVRWSTMRESYPVELILTQEISPRIREYIDTQMLLEARGDMRTQLERLKYSYEGKSLRDYTKAKFEFFNSILHPHGS